MEGEMVRRKKGQSTLEYVILVTAVIVVIIALLMGGNSPFKSALNGTLGTTVDQMNVMGNRLTSSYN
jgi:uncharacterized protein (UPF0333 family)